MVEAQLEPGVQDPFRAWVQSRRDVVLHLLIRARERGEIRPDADLDLAVDQMFGVFWYRLLVGHLSWIRKQLQPTSARCSMA
ncbi:TetR-like C-terminal domain-containing protein [Kineosporia babensis]|uniref:TetR-like C-terminal domain-containing protein n=1 Tax=Kineosporia babensis TaxID=499548 RepID=UPI0038B3C62A